eukprot:5263107-Prymnesium_polylepis.3
MGRAHAARARPKILFAAGTAADCGPSWPGLQVPLLAFPAHELWPPPPTWTQDYSLKRAAHSTRCAPWTGHACTALSWALRDIVMIEARGTECALRRARYRSRRRHAFFARVDSRNVSFAGFATTPAAILCRDRHSEASTVANARGAVARAFTAGSSVQRTSRARKTAVCAERCVEGANVARNKLPVHHDPGVQVWHEIFPSSS